MTMKKTIEKFLTKHKINKIDCLIDKHNYINMFTIWCKILMKTRALFAKRPSRKLTWTCEDYVLGKNWARTQPHPFIKNKTLWDLCYDKQESAYTIDNLNKFLFNEI